MARFQQPRGLMFQQQGAKPPPPPPPGAGLKMTVGPDRLFTTQTKAGKVLPGDFVHPRSVHSVMVVEEDDEATPSVRKTQPCW